MQGGASQLPAAAVGPRMCCSGQEALLCFKGRSHIWGCVPGRSQALPPPSPASPSFSLGRGVQASSAGMWSLTVLAPHPQGNIEFLETEEAGLEQGHVAVAEELLVDHVAQLTATPRELVLRCLLSRTVASGGRELIEKGHTAAEASYARDACAKVLWGQAVGSQVGTPRGLPGGGKDAGSPT